MAHVGYSIDPVRVGRNVAAITGVHTFVIVP
jgi:hypothetical protein